MISAVIITKNEEKNIKNCLESLSWLDEIIIIDDFSMDKTLELSLEFKNVKIFQNKFESFALQRNFGIKKASSPWILSIDADEIVNLELKEEILRNIKNQYSAFEVPTKNYFYGKWLKYGGWYPDYHIRVYKKEEANWDNIIHERINTGGNTLKLKNALEHYGHKDIYTTICKINFYTTFEAVELYKNKERFSIFKLIFIPFFEFINRFFIKLGFLDGLIGFGASIIMFIYKFLVYFKLYELKKNT